MRVYTRESPTRVERVIAEVCESCVNGAGWAMELGAGADENTRLLMLTRGGGSKKGGTENGSDERDENAEDEDDEY